MKISKKLMMWFIIVTLLVSVVGFFSIYSIKQIQNNNDIEESISQYLMAVEELQLKVSGITKTNNISEFNRSLSEINDQKVKVESIYVDGSKAFAEYHEFYDFHGDVLNFNLISNELITIHKEKLVQGDIFSREYVKEKDQRYAIREPLFALNNSKLTENIGFIQYYSKEVLFQYRDQTHLNEWLNSVDDIRKKVDVLNLPLEKKNNLNSNLDIYEQTAETLGKIAIRQKEIEMEESIKIEQLQKILSRLNNAKKEMDSEIYTETKQLSDYFIKIKIVLILSISLICIGFGFMLTNQISKPLTKLRDAAKAVGRGNLDTEIQIDSKDEVGELAAAFKIMTEDLKKTTVSKNYVNNIIESMFGTLIVTDHEGTIITVNKATCGLLGYQEGELVGHPIDIIFENEDNPTKGSILNEIIKNGFIHNKEKKYLTKNGRIIPMLFSGSVMRDVNGNINGIVCIAQDMTARKEIEENLKLFSSAVAAAKDGVQIVGLDGHILYSNPAIKDIFGYSPEELKGKHITDMSADPDFVSSVIFPNIQRTGHWAGEVSVKHKNEKILQIWIAISIIFDNHGKQIAMVGIIHDLTERNRAEEIRIENVQLSQATKAKSEFLANMSHELRTPLNSIIGFTQILKENAASDLNEKHRHFLDNILFSSTHLLDLINEILDISKIESGKFDLVMERISITKIIEEIIILLKEKAANQNVVLKMEFDHSIDLIDADKLRLKQVLFNLISNAVKFSKKEGGTVTIRTRMRNDNVELSISDTGIGIKKENIVKLFTEFHQLDTGYARMYQGTGLGLAISKKLVELHGGKIWVESEYGVGSTFTLTLPSVKRNL